VLQAQRGQEVFDHVVVGPDTEEPDSTGDGEGQHRKGDG
jgi:hypothetical protein